MQDNLSPERHINTYRLLVNMRIAFNFLEEEMLKELIVSVIRSRLKYAAVIGHHTGRD